MADSYIVRIHRRTEKSDHQLDIVGVVEDPIDGHQWVFHNATELWAILKNKDNLVEPNSLLNSPLTR